MPSDPVVPPRVKTVYYATADVADTARFYRDGLGLTERFGDGERWVQFNADGTGVAVASLEEAPEGRPGAYVVFEVADLAAACERAARHGGSVIAERDMGTHGRTVTLRDPGGGILQLFSRAPHPGE